MGLMYSAIVIIPAVIVYWITVSVRPAEIFGGVLLTFLISVFVFVLSPSWMVVAKTAWKLKHKSFVTVLASLLGSEPTISFILRRRRCSEKCLQMRWLWAENKNGCVSAVPFWTYRRGKIPAMIGATAVMAVLTAVTLGCISRSFIGMITSSGKTVLDKIQRAYRKRKGSVPGFIWKRAGAIYGKSELYAELWTWFPFSCGNGHISDREGFLDSAYGGIISGSGQCIYCRYCRLHLPCVCNE